MMLISEWLGENWLGTATLIFSGVVAWGAVESNRLTRRLVDADLDPFVTVNLEARMYQVHVADIVVRNGGRGAATNVRFSVTFGNEPIENTPNSDLLEWKVIADGVPLLGPGQEIRSAYGTYAEIDAQQSEAVVQVTYERMRAATEKPKTFQATYVLDIQQLVGTQQIGAMIEEEKLRALTKISNDIHAVTHNSDNHLNVLVTRRYAPSFIIDRFVYRWFGRRHLSGSSYWEHLRREFRRTLSQRLKRWSSLLKCRRFK